MKVYTSLSGQEFIKKLLSGERDFLRIKLEEGYNISNKDNSRTNEFYT